MSYNVSICKLNMFDDEDVNKTFEKNFGEIPETDLTIDFINEGIYKFYNQKIIQEYVDIIKDNNMITFVYYKIMKELMKNHPELNDEFNEIKSKLDSDKISEEFLNYMLPIK